MNVYLCFHYLLIPVYCGTCVLTSPKYVQAKLKLTLSDNARTLSNHNLLLIPNTVCVPVDITEEERDSVKDLSLEDVLAQSKESRSNTSVQKVVCVCVCILHVYMRLHLLFCWY